MPAELASVIPNEVQPSEATHDFLNYRNGTKQILCVLQKGIHKQL